MALTREGARKEAALELVAKQLLPQFIGEKAEMDRIDKWYRWDHGKPHQPRQATAEYQELSDKAQVPWLDLVVSTATQGLYVDGYRGADDPQNASAWGHWQANGMDARQVPLHRSALAYGQAYLSVLPGEDPITGDKMPAIKGHSPRNMMAFYRDPANDEFPEFAIRVEGSELEGGLKSWDIWLYDESRRWTLKGGGDGQPVEYVTHDEHNLGFCPVVRYANKIDLEGRTPGEVAPLIPLAGRIDQTVFDRLVVQRFGAWIVRTVSGMAPPENDEEEKAVALLLRMSDLLVADDPGVKFGHLPATPLDGFIRAAESDVETLAAVSQTPMYALVGKFINVSAEGMEVARASFIGKLEERQVSLGESHETTMRVSSYVMGEKEAARDRASQVRWRTTRIRSLAQTADALAKLAKIAGMPVEMLFEQIPEWTQQDVARAIAAAEKARASLVTPPAEQAGT